MEYIWFLFFVYLRYEKRCYTQIRRILLDI